MSPALPASAQSIGSYQNLGCLRYEVLSFSIHYPACSQKSHLRGWIYLRSTHVSCVRSHSRQVSKSPSALCGYLGSSHLTWAKTPTWKEHLDVIRPVSLSEAALPPEATLPPGACPSEPSANFVYPNPRLPLPS